MKETRQCIYVIIFNAIVSLLVALVLANEEFTFYIEEPFITLNSKIRGKLVTDNVVLINIDQKSFELYGRWPWERTLMAQLIDITAKQNPKVIGIPILFLNKSDDKNDKALTDSIEKAGNVVLGYMRSAALYPFNYQKDSSQSQPSKFDIGFLEVVRDSTARVVGVSPAIEKEGKDHKAFACVVAAKWDAKVSLQIENKYGLLRANFYGPQGTFRHISARNILTGETKESLEGKVVLISAADDVLFYVNTGWGPMSLSEVHANLIQNCIEGTGLRFDPIINYIFCFAGGTILGILVIKRKSLGIAILLAGYFASTHLFFSSNALIVSSISFLFVLLLNWLLIAGVRRLDIFQDAGKVETKR